MKVNLGRYWKAIIGFVGPGVAIIGSSLLPTSDGGSKITTTEWATALVACVGTAVTVYAKSNSPEEPFDVNADLPSEESLHD